MRWTDAPSVRLAAETAPPRRVAPGSAGEDTLGFTDGLVGLDYDLGVFDEGGGGLDGDYQLMTGPDDGRDSSEHGPAVQ
jgi:hypothetical protein